MTHSGSVVSSVISVSGAIEELLAGLGHLALGNWLSVTIPRTPLVWIDALPCQP